MALLAFPDDRADRIMLAVLGQNGNGELELIHILLTQGRSGLTIGDQLGLAHLTLEEIRNLAPAQVVREDGIQERMGELLILLGIVVVQLLLLLLGEGIVIEVVVLLDLVEENILFVVDCRTIVLIHGWFLH